MKPSLALIGPGKVGCAVSKRLREAGYPLTAVISREHSRAVAGCRFIGVAEQAAATDLQSACGADLILLAVPDDQIARLAASLREQLPKLTGKTLLHFSGLHPAAIMGAPGCPAQLLSIHPLLPFADRSLASERLSGCPCAVEGEAAAVPLGIELVEAFGGQTFHIASDKKALYHASACVASNYLATLLASAAELLTECDIEQQQAITLLSPLVQATLDNVAKLGPERGLTGPIVRGDQGTVSSHLNALRNAPAHIEALYRFLGRETVELAAKSSRLPKDKAAKINKIISRNLSDPAE